MRFLEVVVALAIKKFEQRRPKFTSRTHIYLLAFHSSWVPLLRARLWSLFLVFIRSLITAVMDGFDLRFSFRVFMVA